MKKILASATALFLVAFCLCTVAYAAPKRVAVLPTLNYNSYNLDKSDLDNVQKKVMRDMHIPLNGILEKTAEIPAADAIAAFEASLSEVSRSSTDPLAEAVAIAADKLDADILVLPVAEKCRQDIFHRGNGEQYMISHATFAIYVYDKVGDGVNRYDAYDSHNGSFDSYWQVRAMLDRCVYKALQKANLRQLI